MNDEQIDYEYVSSGWREFREKVLYLLSKGWKLQGGICVSHTYNGDTNYSQAFWRPMQVKAIK